MGTIATAYKPLSEMTRYEKIKEAFCYCPYPFEQSALRCMAQGLMPYDEAFVMKWIERKI